MKGQDGLVRSQPKRPRVSPLRYPGGKSALYGRLRQLVRANDLTDGIYVEPYAGGAGAALALLVTGQVRRIVINDLDPCVFAFWKALVDEPQQLSKLVSGAKLNVDEWKRQRSIYDNVTRDDYLRLGYATFYLNRTNRSGALNGGPIGGHDQTGNYKIDARFNKEALLERMRVIALYGKRIAVTNVDGLNVIRRYAKRDDSLIYADPPYFDKAGSLYMNSFLRADHEKLAGCLNRLPAAKWLLTYDNVPEVATLYAERRRQLFDLHYSAHRVMRTQEVMIFSDALAGVATTSW